MTLKKPNILVILDDQHRHDFVGCVGANFVHTPNLDALATRGMVFTHCCTNSPICAPARIALATGLLPTRTGTTSNYSFMPISVPNHYRYFRDHDYRVELVGRHDLAKPGAPASIYGNRPLNFSYGFTRALEIEGGMAAAMEAPQHGPMGPYTKYLEAVGLLDAYVEDFLRRFEKGWIIGVSHDSVLPKEHHQDVFIGRKAVERIEQIEDDYPWYMLVSFQSPHDPFDPPSELGEKYRQAQLPDPIPARMEGKPRRIRARFERLYRHATEEDIRTARRQYCAKIELVDEQIGHILKALVKRGFFENTIVVFTSDHGEQAGDLGLFIKHNAYESSLRVPLIIAGPMIQKGICDGLVELFDLNPTLTELAGLSPQTRLDARSFAPILRGETNIHRNNCVACEHLYRAIRTERFKLIETFNDTLELYDLTADPGEIYNIAENSLDVVTDLMMTINQRFTEDRWKR